jgi:hypothetical protein
VRYWLAGLLTAHLAFAAAPDIDSISPLALWPGVPVKITLSGSDLSEATQLWTSFPAQVESLGGARFQITANAAVGIGAIRMFGSNGVSNPFLVMLDDLPTITEAKTNKTRTTAQAIEFGSAVDGVCDELSFDWFKLRANKGQRVSIEMVAARLGSKLDSVLRVVSASGRELARNDDAPGLRGDSFIVFIAPESADYFIEVRDVNYGGGSEYFYHLRVGDFPLVTTTFPIAVDQDSQSLHLTGPNGEIGEATAKGQTNASTLTVAIKGRTGSAFAKALMSDRHEAIEREPNDSAAKATKILIADGINGRFDKPNDRDCYEFTARKGDRIEFRAATRSIGSPCDAVLEIDSADGRQLARSNPSAADEGVVTHNFASNGVYRLVVEEATGAFGPNMIYRVVSRRAAGFALTLDADRVNVAPGKSFDLKVTVARGDYKGAVTLTLDGFPDVVLTNNVIAENKTNVTMKVTAPDSLVPGTWREFSVQGNAKRNGEDVHVRASTAPALRRRWPLLLYPPVEFDGMISLGVTSPK